MSYVRNCWYVAAWDVDLPAGAPAAVSILGEPLVLWRDADGGVHALADRCVHRMAPLSLGRCEGMRLRCLYHGLAYDTAGRVVEIPGQDVIPPQARVRAYPVVVRHSWVWVWMGDPALADAQLIPPAVGLDDPRFVLGHGQLDYAAQARLINDNLLDFSHLTYVHAKSFGAGSTFADSPMKITALERGVRFQRWVEAQDPGRGSRVLGAGMDNFMTYDFLLPGVLLMQSGSFPPGAARALDFASPDFADATAGVTFTSQAVTPVTAQSARYFFSWGPRRDHGDESLRDQLMGIAGVAFAEDKAMIEAQQRVIDATPVPSIMPTVHDRGVTLFNRMVERLCRAEADAGTPAHA